MRDVYKYEYWQNFTEHDTLKNKKCSFNFKEGLPMWIGLSIFVLAILVAIQFDRETKEKNITFFPIWVPDMNPNDPPVEILLLHAPAPYANIIYKKETHRVRAFLYAFGFIILMTGLTVGMSRYILNEGIEQGFLQGTGYLREETYFQKDTIYMVEWKFQAPIFDEGNLISIRDEHDNRVLWHIINAPLHTIHEGIFIVDRDAKGTMTLRGRANFTDEEKKRYEAYRNKRI